MREGIAGEEAAATERAPGDGQATAAPIEIDGARGEGGGQILRTSLALALITGRPLRMRRIRAGRAKPGLRRQHLACVEAAARLCHGEVRGADVGSQELELIPGPITGGVLDLDIGTAGSTTLVVQTILVPAIAAGVALRAVIRGGTHNPLAPPFEFLDRVYAPHLRAMGARVEFTLDHHGFASGGAGRPTRDQAADRGARPARNPRQDPGARPARDQALDLGGRPTRDPAADRDARPARDRAKDRGARPARDQAQDLGGSHVAAPRDRASSRRDGTGEPRDHSLGQLTMVLDTGGALRPVDIVDAGPITARRATAILARLPTHVAQRELEIAQRRLGFAATDCEVREVEGGPANVLMLEIEHGPCRELVTAFGEKGLRAEAVAERACDELAAFLAAGVPVGEHLADQLLLPMAVAGGGRFRAAPLSLHATTNIETIQQFLDVAIRVEPDGDAVLVTVG